MSGTIHIDASDERPMANVGGYSFPRTAKLLKHASFDQVYRRGQRHFSGLMTVFFLRWDTPVAKEPETNASLLEASRPEELDPPPSALFRVGGATGARVGLTIGRVLGPSVVRNRIRRRMREAVRFNLDRLTGPVDVVINPKKVVLTAEFDSIVEEVRKAFIAIEKRRGPFSNPPRREAKRTKGRES